jgi:hypothetical protein
MFQLSSLHLVLAGAIAVSAAQSVNLTGTISNQNGKPISGAIVTLARQTLKDTTGSNGIYAIASPTPVTTAPILPESEKSTITNGFLSISLTKPTSIRIELYAINGHLLTRVHHRNAPAGDYRFNLAAKRHSAQTVIITLSIGERASTFRYLPLPGSRHSVSFGAAEPFGHVQVLISAPVAVDSIKVSKSGYLAKSMPITSYQGTINITLDTAAALPRFSFFVTSLKALQELSGSQNGFGGDFRFGKTGAGAGLKGADSICSCIAERSMPGSRVKQWRAFLSVAADETGKQVNAIDRIGQGPWYDRLGRVLAPTRADLLNTRPMNGDPAIANDLPNEDGVPNHRPDGITTVDNHHFVTGSSTSGTLYSSTTTCNDWTSVTASSRPRCGFSWPRSSTNGNHWISGFDAAGCVAGIHISSSGGGSGNIIGSGGGYGGFYCFALTP